MLNQLSISIPFNTLLISLDGWIIRDGNYPDFFSGQHCTFGLNINEKHHQFGLSKAQKKELIPAKDAAYLATGEVLYHNLDSGLLIIDFGVIAYLETSQYGSAVSPGDYLTGKISLCVDYYICKDYFRYHREDVPAMLYRWQVKEVLINSGPHNNSDNFFQRAYDEFVPIHKTYAWQDDNGFSDYLLRCQLLSEKPKAWW